ncbi:MAG: PUR family DNA/RNA-binding protein [Bacteroidales bacterium]|jgi:hypothetical protein|nr:PUR family DNA/RNA-binding protein [Bacteroidales bacterium]
METPRERDEIFSRAFKAKKRTYFFDVKETRTGDRYITITESKRRFDQEEGTFTYEKHKIFLYKEDQAEFVDTLEKMIEYIKTGVEPVFEDAAAPKEEDTLSGEFDDFSFDIKD